MSVIMHKDQDEVHVYQLVDGPLSGRTFYGAHTIVCTNPTCPCTDMSFLLWQHSDRARSGPSEGSCRILIDVANRRLSKGRPAAEITNDLPLAEAFISHLTEEHWNVLYRDLLRQRRALLRDAKSLESAHFDFSDLEEEIELESETVPFDTVFPFAQAFDLEVRGMRVTLLDQYCVNPRCTCTNAIISAFPAVGFVDPADDEPIKPIFTVSHDYRSHTATMLDDFAGETGVELFLDAPKADLKRISTIVKKRHHILRSVYRSYRERAGVFRGNSGANRESSSAPFYLDDPPFEGSFLIEDDLPRGKVGRNEPCPCGSGRKYKYCCGR